MPNLVCDKCGKYYKEDKSVNKQKCDCGGKLRSIDPKKVKKESRLANEPKKLAYLTSKSYIPLVMIFMVILVGILIFVAASSVLDPAAFYDVKCPYCGSNDVKQIDSDVTDSSLGIFEPVDVYVCQKCQKQFYYSKEDGESVKY